MNDKIPPVLAPKLQPLIDDNILAGAVMAVASKDETLALEAVGYSDWAAKRPMAPDDLFWVASMAKPITGTAVMMLVDEGKISLDDPVEKYLPEFKGMIVSPKEDPAKTVTPASHPLTIREVLSHTSGLHFCSPPESEGNGALDRLPLAVAVASHARIPLNAQPGTVYSYSNAGINTAARILEIVSGMSYEDFMDQRLFHPLSMKDTTFFPTTAQVKRLAKAYQPKPAPEYLEEIPISQLTYPLDKREGRYPMPAGGLFSTAPDIIRFCQMILQGGTFEGRQYLSPEAIAVMTSKQTGPLVEATYGLGWDAPPSGVTGHGGALQTYMGIDTKAGLIRVFLIQIQGPWLSDRGEKVAPTFVEATQVFAVKPDASTASFRVEGQVSRR
jgi:CubicO group peptidase (beta-lactamase class C family)